MKGYIRATKGSNNNEMTTYTMVKKAIFNGQKRG
jgi:hypothetical protein